MYFRAMKNYQSMNVVHVTPEGNQLWLGDYYAATDLNLLKQKKITSVLTAAAMLGVSYPKDMGMNHKIINAFDIPTYKMTPHFPEAYNFIKDALQKGNILVHCAAGISRSTTFVLVYLMKEKGFTLNQGIQYVRSKRPIINPNYGFQNELSKLELQIKKGSMANTGNFGKMQISHGLSEKQQKTVAEIEEQKSAFEKFVKRESGMNKTTGSYGQSQGDRFKSTGAKGNAQNQKVERGQSVNYRKTFNNNNTYLPSKINNLTFKLQQPKIVTIKR